MPLAQCLNFYRGANLIANPNFAEVDSPEWAKYWTRSIVSHVSLAPMTTFERLFAKNPCLKLLASNNTGNTAGTDPFPLPEPDCCEERQRAIHASITKQEQMEHSR